MEPARGKEISYGFSFNDFGLHYSTMVGSYTDNNLTMGGGTAILWPMSPPPEFRDLISKLTYQPENVYAANDEHFGSFKGCLAAFENVTTENGVEVVKIHSFLRTIGSKSFWFTKQHAWPNE
jgi:hypothetical protein